ncbi:MAG: lipocalin-like domain-containing protein [Pseudomonadota bacterium]
MTVMKDLFGSWSLVSFQVTLDKGGVTAPYGPDPLGRLVYTSNGYMSAHLMARERPIPEGAAVEARALAIARTHFSYAGQFRIEGAEVVHVVDMAMSPDWIGQEKRRTIEWDGADLILTEKRARLGRDFGVGRLRWSRENSAGV